jgi:tetratricopeptide (TPR) repeat protein
MRFLAALAVLSLVVSGTAFAQPKTAIPPSDDIEAAKAHYAAGSAYYEQANYADAVKEFNEAYRLSHRSDLLYNIAVCYERLSQYDNAIKALKQYLTDKPDAGDRVTIETRITNLEKLREQAAPPPRVVEPPKPAPPPPPPVVVSERPRHWWVPGTSVAAAGAAVLAASLGTGLAANSIYNDLNSKCQNKVCDPSLQSQQSKGNSLAIASDVLLGVGAAAALTGVILLIVQSRHPRATSHARVTPTVRGLQVRF